MQADVGHTAAVTALAATPDGTLAVSGSKDRTLRVWDLETGKLAGVMSGHQAEVRAVAITPDGTLVFSGSNDGSLRLWSRVDTAAVSTVLSQHEAPVLAVSLSEDARRLVSGSADGMVRVWDVASSSLVREFRAGTSGHRVHLSYARADRQLAEEIARMLDARGLSVYADLTDARAGDDLATGYPRAVAESELLIALVTPAAVASHWFGRELTYALQRRVPVLPVISGSPRLRESLPEPLHSVEGVLLSDAREESLRRLVARVAQVLDGTDGERARFHSLLLGRLAQLRDQR
jgi:hypothetical protein